MSVATNKRQARVRVPQAVRRRVQISLERLFARGDASALIIALGILLMPMFSLIAAEWPIDVRIVLPIAILSLLFGFLLARSQYNELLALMMSSIYGVAFVLLTAALNQPGGLRTGVYEVFNRVVLWGYAAFNAGVNPDDLIFTMMVAMLFWFLGYNIAWHIFRVDRLFRVVMPPAVILLTNTVYYNGEADLRPYVVVFVFLGLLLSVRSHLDAQEWDWYMAGMRIPNRVRRQFNAVGMALALMVVLASWSVPSNNLQQRLNAFQEFMQADPFQQMSDVWSRLFSTIEAYGPVTADYYGGDSLTLSGAIQLGDQDVMRVSVPAGRRYYWRSRIFDTYQDGNWTSQALKRVPYLEPPFQVGGAYDDQSREPVQQQFTISLNASRLVYAAPQPASIDLVVQADVRFLDPAETLINLYVVRPFRLLERNDTYTATSLMTTATAAQLRAAGENYPDWIGETQLYVPPSVTGRTLALAQNIVTEAAAATPYDKAKAIERWLRANIEYNENIPQPPPNQDPIDWVLFDYREGYCNYYASAMVMMLRSQGIPARMAAGFAQGEWDGSGFVVRERDAHTWVEVYFPGYGWIEFEPTAAQQPINRGDDDVQLLPVPTNTPQATATPTLPPTPSSTPTPQETISPPEDEALSLPTSTPTLTPTPTATPVIIPTQAPPNQPTNTGALAWVWPAFVTALLVLTLVLVIVGIGVFVWWWWEWRGMRGYSPAVRAYARLERYVVGLLGLPLSERDTPDERGRRIADELPRRANRPVGAITRMYVEERYGRGPGDKVDVAHHAKQADKAWDRARENILLRWLRRVIPFSRWLLPERD
jgi:transglutaminase-like putative cysteine protease